MNTDRFGTPQLTFQGESLFPRRERNGRTQHLASACESFGHFSICLTNVSAGYTERQSSSAS